MGFVYLSIFVKLLEKQWVFEAGQEMGFVGLCAWLKLNIAVFLCVFLMDCEVSTSQFCSVFLQWKRGKYSDVIEFSF